MVALACAGAPVARRATPLPRAAELQIRLEEEPPLDRETGEPSVVDVEGTLTAIQPADVRPFTRRITLRVGPGQRFHLLTFVPAAIPFQVGETVRMRYAARFDPASELTRRAVLLTDASGGARLVLQDTGLLDETLVPPMVRGRPAEGAAVYTEAGRLSRFCYSVLEHRMLAFGDGPDAFALAPGLRRTLTVDGHPWLVVAVDNATTVKRACPDYKADRLAWFAARLPLPPGQR